MRKNYKTVAKSLKNASNYNTVVDTTNAIDNIIRENSNDSEYERYIKRVKSYDELVAYVTSNVTAIEFYYQIELKKMSNNSLSVKTRKTADNRISKRICRIDSAYDKIRITSDRVDVLRDVHESFDERTDASMHHYAIVKLSVDEFASVFNKIISNAKSLNLLTA